MGQNSVTLSPFFLFDLSGFHNYEMMVKRTIDQVVLFLQLCWRSISSIGGQLMNHEGLFQMMLNLIKKQKH